MSVRHLPMAFSSAGLGMPCPASYAASSLLLPAPQHPTGAELPSSRDTLSNRVLWLEKESLFYIIWGGGWGGCFCYRPSRWSTTSPIKAANALPRAARCETQTSPAKERKGQRCLPQPEQEADGPVQNPIFPLFLFLSDTTERRASEEEGSKKLEKNRRPRMRTMRCSARKSRLAGAETENEALPGTRHLEKDPRAQKNAVCTKAGRCRRGLSTGGRVQLK